MVSAMWKARDLFLSAIISIASLFFACIWLLLDKITHYIFSAASLIMWTLAGLLAITIMLGCLVLHFRSLFIFSVVIWWLNAGFLFFFPDCRFLLTWVQNKNEGQWNYCINECEEVGSSEECKDSGSPGALEQQFLERPFSLLLSHPALSFMSQKCKLQYHGFLSSSPTCSCCRCIFLPPLVKICIAVCGNCSPQNRGEMFKWWCNVPLTCSHVCFLCIHI